MKIRWEPPPPRRGWQGAWDRFIGPGAKETELWLQLGGGLLLTAVIAFHLFTGSTVQNWTTLQLIVALLIAFDVSGGVLTNATNSAKRWYHRPGQGFSAHFGFVAVHALHLFLVAWLFRQMDWLYFGVYYGVLLMATAVILKVPLYLQRPSALFFYAGVLLLNNLIVLPAPGLAWFIPLFFLKILVCHLLKEAPFAPESQ